MQPRPLLLVDDNLADLELALEALEQFRLRIPIVVARDGADALDYLFRRGGFADRPSGDPAVVFLDLKMPKVDGLEVLRQIKGSPVLRTIPVVMMTSSREEADVARSYQLGANAYMVKPTGFQESMDAIKHLGEFWIELNELPGRAV